MPHAAGKKVAAKHGSVIDVAEGLVAVAVGMDCVTKVVLGLIKHAKGAPVDKSLKITEIPAGLQLKVRGPKNVQLLFIYTSDRASVAATITKQFGS